MFITYHGWLVVEPYPPEKYDFVSWEFELSNIWKNNSHVPNHQPDGDTSA